MGLIKFTIELRPADYNNAKEKTIPWLIKLDAQQRELFKNFDKISVYGVKKVLSIIN